MPLKWLKKFIEEQDGRCIRCNELFEHCGGSKEHAVLIPSLFSIKYTIGVVCAACLDEIDQVVSDFCIQPKITERDTFRRLSANRFQAGKLPGKKLEIDMKIEYRGLTIETIPADGGLYDVVIDGNTDILKRVHGEEKAVSNAKQLIDIFLEDLRQGRN